MGNAFLDEDLDEVDFEITDLGANEIHEWALPLDDSEEYVFTIIGEPDMDIQIVVLDENLTELVNQDANSIGQSESISFSPTQTGDYKIQVSEASGIDGGYLLTLSEDDFLLLPQGLLTYGNDGQGIIDSIEEHYWFFRGEEDAVIDLAISCEVYADLLVTLFDAEEAEIEAIFAEEDMQDVLLPETGWYLFSIGLWDETDSCDYTLLVTEQ